MTTTDIAELQRAIREKVGSGAVRGVICWERGSNAFRSRPGVIRTPGEASNTVFSPACSAGLVRFLIEDNRYPMNPEDDKRPIGIVLRGCDDRGVIELIKEHQKRREDIVIFGVDCRGVIDWMKARRLLKKGILSTEDIVSGKITWKDDEIVLVRPDGEEKKLSREGVLLEKCIICEGHTPRIFDVMIGREDRDRKNAPIIEAIEILERKSTDERWDFWRSEFSRCVRCYACRNVCTYCSCEECAIDPRTQAISDKSSARDKANRPQWTGQDSSLPSNAFYLVARAYHGAGRCTTCEECDRACPMGLSLRLLNRKVRKDVKRLFDYEAGRSIEDKSLYGESCDKDPGDFIW
ncbi:MAG: 4Fe-4S dicluster domain-containing protein [Thermoplasmata archaeon]